MKPMEIRHTLLAVACSAFLCACGGGGGGDAGGGDSTGTGPTNGGNPSTPPGNDNPPPSTQPTSNVKLADPANDFANVKTAYAAVSALAQDVIDPYGDLTSLVRNIDPSLLIQGSSEQTSACLDSGSETVAIHHVDQSQSLAVGDTFTFTFNNCRDKSTTKQSYISGGMSITIRSLTGNPNSNGQQPSHVVMDATANQLVVETFRGTTGLINGTISLDENSGGGQTSPSSTTATLRDITYANTSASGNVISLAAPGLVLTDTSDPTDGENLKYEGPLNVVFNNGASQLYMTVSTPTPVDAFIPEFSPGKGVIALTSGDEVVSATYIQHDTSEVFGNNLVDITGSATVSTDVEGLNDILTK